jgi:hypothetical protein
MKMQVRYLMVPYIKRKIIKKKGISFEKIDDLIAVEKRLRVFINKKEEVLCVILLMKLLIPGQQKYLFRRV